MGSPDAAREYGASSPPPATPEELGVCLRDLIGLLALPSMWRERDERGILRTMLEAVETSIWFECALARVRTDEGPIEVLRVDGRFVDDAASPWRRIGESFAPALAATAPVETPAGPLIVTHLPLGYHGTRGSVLFASRREGFPSLTDAVLLRAAASLTDSAVETARILEQRERAIRTKDEFLAMLGHELRNPLAPIATAVELMRMRAGGEVPRELAVIDRQVRQLLRLVDDLLDVSRVARGKIELHREPVEVNQLLAGALETASPWLDRAGHHLQMDVDPHVVLDVDPGRIAQVLANLLTNAAKYTPPGGRIEVSVRRGERTARISVRDSGVGIPAELQPRIFDMFVQGRRSRARSEGGLGIGLALVKNLVLLHGGQVGVESEGPGKGSTFTITLPLAASVAAAAADAAPEPSHAVLTGCRLLLVDDNVDAATLLAELLRQRGASVTVAYDSLDAIEKAAQVLPHVAVIDIGLPVLDGYELIEALRQRLGAAMPRVFALTGYGQETDKARSRTAGFAGHFVKPVEIEALVAALR